MTDDKLQHLDNPAELVPELRRLTEINATLLAACEVALVYIEDRGGPESVRARRDLRAAIAKARGA